MMNLRSDQQGDKNFHIGAAAVTLVVLLLLPLSLAMDDSELDHGGGSGSNGSLVAAAVAWLRRWRTMGGESSWQQQH
jgi:hypothetical protein